LPRKTQPERRSAVLESDLAARLAECDYRVYNRPGARESLLVNDREHLRTRPRKRFFVPSRLVTNASPTYAAQYALGTTGFYTRAE
jgi:hypothetical protein